MVPLPELSKGRSNVQCRVSRHTEKLAKGRISNHEKTNEVRVTSKVGTPLRQKAKVYQRNNGPACALALFKATIINSLGKIFSYSEMYYS